MVLDAEKMRHLAGVAMQKKTAPGPSAPRPSAPDLKDKRLKRVAEVVEVAPSEDDETCSGLVFKKKRKADAAIPVPSDSDGRALSYRECPPNAFSPRNVVVHEGIEESSSEGDQWESFADLSSFLQKVFHSTRTKERLDNLEEDPLLEHVPRQLGETLVGTSLLLSKMQRAKEMASQEALQTTKLKCRMIGLTLEVEELHKTDRETKSLLFEKS